MELFELQVLAAYAMGTLVGWFLKAQVGVGRLIERLIDDGFIRTRENDEGETVIVKWYDNAKG